MINAWLIFFQNRDYRLERLIVPRGVLTPVQTANGIDVLDNFNFRIPDDTVNKINEQYSSDFLPGV